MDKLDTFIFDLGNVLIDWNPSYLFDHVFENDPDKKNYFFTHICTEEWHAQQDAGRPVEIATNILLQRHPDWEEPIKAFYARWKEMFRGPIVGTVDLLKQLKEKNYKLYALTNWSAELFKFALEDFPFLQWFDGIVVSGQERINKPALEIYLILLNKYNINPQRALFIDDKEKNVIAAEKVGLHGLQFQSPELLKAELVHAGALDL